MRNIWAPKDTSPRLIHTQLSQHYYHWLPDIGGHLSSHQSESQRCCTAHRRVQAWRTCCNWNEERGKDQRKQQEGSELRMCEAAAYRLSETQRTCGSTLASRVESCGPNPQSVKVQIHSKLEHTIFLSFGPAVPPEASEVSKIHPRRSVLQNLSWRAASGRLSLFLTQPDWP